MRVIADTHLAPGETLDVYVDLICGDSIDAIPLGCRAYMTEEGQKTIRSIAEHCPLICCGNHDPYKALVKLFKGYDISILEECATGFNGVDYYFRHGDAYAQDWVILRRFAYTWTELVTRFSLTRKLWYKFCRMKGWM